MARRALLDRLETPPRAVHRIRGEIRMESAADEYDAELAGVALELVLLGLGADGHTASLYPDAPALEETERRAVAAEAKLEPYVDRVTMTIPTLASAPLVVFLVTGAEKAEAARHAFAEPPSDATPASLIRSRTGRTLAILDPAAAENLRI